MILGIWLYFYFSFTYTVLFYCTVFFIDSREKWVETTLPKTGETVNYCFNG